jgi:hypothetical protein
VRDVWLLSAGVVGQVVLESRDPIGLAVDSSGLCCLFTAEDTELSTLGKFEIVGILLADVARDLKLV